MPPYVASKKRARSPSPDRSTTKRTKKTPSSTRKPTLFDALDAPSTSRKPSGKTKAILEKLANEDDSELSSLETTPEFDDVPLNDGGDEEEDDEDIEFEDVQSKHTSVPTQSAPAPSGDLDLTLRKDTRIQMTNPHGDKKGPSKIERKIRVDTHCMHVQSLMWHNALRNSWLCDVEVQAILLSHLPPQIWAEIEKWRIRGVPGGAAKPRDAELDGSKGKSKGKEKAGKKGKEKSRDWSDAAERQEQGVVDMSHGDPLFNLMTKLSKWWKGRFQITAAGIRKMGYMSLERLDQEIKGFKEHESVPDKDYDTELHGERIRTIDGLKACAQDLQGSRDVGAQLFTALLRGLGLEARMIASLQPVGFGWSKAEEAVERKEKKSKNDEPSLLEEDFNGEDDTDDEIPVKKVVKPRKTKNGKAEPATKSRGAARGRKKSTPISLEDSEPEEEASDVDDDESVVELDVKPKVNGSKKFDKDLLFPHYWTEVLSPATNKYLAVDPLILNIVATNADLLASFEPRGAKADKAKQVLAYVVGHSADGTAKDVTVRYLKKHMWPGRTKGMRMTIEKIPIYGRHGKVKRYVEYDWFQAVMSGYVRGTEKCPRTEIDDEEDSTDLKAIKPEKKEVKEGEETLQSYKTSDTYVLERHLKREEAIVSTAKHVKMFTVKGKGGATTQEKVFLRKDVVKCKTTETWHKEGREPKRGEVPRKRVPYRAATTNRKRELAEAEAAAGEKPLQGLFSIDQTDFIIPPPIKDGIIPKNQYGNIDCYVPSMVPQGAVHLPYRGTMRVCKKLGIDFAEAVTGFEFGARMAVPIVTGVVVAEENAEMVMEQWQVDEAERVRKEDEKRTKFALGMWRKFMMGLRIIERVREEYGDEADNNADLLNPWTNKNTSGKSKGKEKIDEEAQRRIMEQKEEEMAGGFFPEGMSVEEPAQAFFPAQDAEEGGGGFFPVDAEEEENDGGGFVVENGDVDEQPMRFVYPTPASLKQNANDEDPQEESDASAAGSEVKQKVPSKAKTPASRKKSTQVTPASNRGRGRPPGKAATASSKSKGKRKRGALLSEDEDEAESSPLSDVEVDSGEDPKPAKKSKAKTRSANTPKTRAAPKRGAAKKSEKAVRSHYFNDSGDDDDE